ncbi:MAG TPA: PLP-dependent aminotransferase family protein [Solirubrobacteraceae bacterium]|jgi:GntR family transcriptional regulator/MocR family aminotransferase
MKGLRTGSADETRWWSLERGPGETLRGALERTLRKAIVDGALRAGVALPSSRALAQELGVSRGVVTDAYDQLASQGFLTVRARSAPVVAPLIASTVPATPRPPADRPPLYDLSPTTPDVNLFPLTRWLATTQRVARESGHLMLDYRESQGEPALRRALADHLGRTRGVIVDPDHLIVTQGTAQSVDVLLRVLRARGARRLAVENPSHARQQERVIAAGLSLVAQPIDAGGIVVGDLDTDAVLVTPAHQFPTGLVMSADRRRALLGWARNRRALVIEDDYDAEFRYDQEPVRALQGLAPDLVVQMGTVSKTLAPALRLGWLTAPPDLLEQATIQKCLIDDFSPALNQLALAEFLRSGDYDRHVRRARRVYRARRDRLLDALADELPELPVTGVAAGVHVLLQLPPDVDDVAVAAKAWEARLLIPPLSDFYADAPLARGLVIGYGRLHESAVEPAVKALAAAVRAVMYR